MKETLKQSGQNVFSAAGLAGLSEAMFLFVFAAYQILLTLGSTMFSLSLPIDINQILINALLVTGILKLIFQLAVAEKESRKTQLKIIFAALPTALMWMLVWRNGGGQFSCFLALLTVACIGTDYRKILRWSAVSIGTTVLAAVLCSFSGSIQNLVYAQGDRLRSAWGICYPTDLSAYTVFLCLIAWTAWKDVPDLFFLLPGTLSLVLAKTITGSHTGVICSVLFLLLVLISMALENKENKQLSKLIHIGSAASFPMLGLGMIGMTWAYHEGSTFAEKMNTWNHSRFVHASSVYDEIGLSLFGIPFEQHGGGGGVLGNANYRFVDCSYLLILLRYGVVTLIMLAILWILMSTAAARLRDRRMLLAFLVIAFHCMSEHHYTELNYNPFLILPFSLFLTASAPASPQTPEEQASHQQWRRTGSFLAVSTVLGAVLSLIFPWFTTICNLYNLGGSWKRRQFLFLTVFAGLTALIFFTKASAEHLTAVWEKRKPSRNAAVFTGFLAFCFLCGLLAANSLIRNAQIQTAETLESERPAIEAVQSVPACRVYADNLPVLYRRHFGGIDRSLFHGEDLAREKNLAVITDADNDLNILINRGFLYTEISENQAIYTDSQEAINALQAAGYHLTGYYSRNREINLSELSWTAYGKDLEEEGSINLTAQGAIERGIRNDLYGATYRITCDLKIVSEGESLPAPKDAVCTFRVVSYPGDTLLAEREVLFSEFDESGNCRMAMDLTMGNTYWVEFLIEPKRGEYTLNLLGIHYQKITDVDTRVLCDDKGHRIKEFYFDPETGKPYTTSDGSQGKEFDYDKAGNTTLIRYLDTEGNPVMSTFGYAELHRTYNEKKQIVYEEYLDTDGLPYMRAAGYTAIEQEYDGEGHLLVRRYLDPDGMPVQRTDGFTEARWEKPEGSPVWSMKLFTLSEDPIPLDGINLAKDIAADEWSEWMRPIFNTVNSTMNIGNVNLGEKTEGDTYTCQIEIEFAGVTATEGMQFGFWTQGSADGAWNAGNVWDPSLVRLETVPEDGIYYFTVSRTINDAMAEASTFNIGFRCDNWASGTFRVRNVKIEKGAEASLWTPGI